MKIGLKRQVICAVLSVLFSFSIISPAFAGSPSAPHPDRPNIVYDVSIRKTAVVHMVNTTPYNMTFKNGPFVNHVTQQAVQGDYDEGPIIYTPSGIPYQIPPRTGGSFVVSWQDTGKDADHVFPEADITYTLKSVDSSDLYLSGACTTNAAVGDVDIHLEFDRVKETKSLKSEIFKTILHTTAMLVDATEFILEGNPIAFAGFVVAATETAEDIASLVNGANESWDQIYVNSFVVPYNNNLAYVPGIVSKYSTSDTAAPYDGIATEQPPANGCPQSDIVVQVALLREKPPTSGGHLNGQLPAVLVTVSTYKDWMAASAATTSVSLQASSSGNKISQQLKREGRSGQKAFFKLVRSMKKPDLDILKAAYRAIEDKKALSHEQELKLAELATAFEKHLTTMPTSSGRPTLDRTTTDHKTPSQALPDNRPVRQTK